MNEKALQTLYVLAQGEGYGKSYDEFVSLMSSNQDAVNNMYSLSKKNGYSKSAEDFNVLVGFTGVKKKDDTISPSEQEGTSGELDTAQEEASTDGVFSALKKTKPKPKEEPKPEEKEETLYDIYGINRPGEGVLWGKEEDPREPKQTGVMAGAIPSNQPVEKEKDIFEPLPGDSENIRYKVDYSGSTPVWVSMTTEDMGSITLSDSKKVEGLKTKTITDPKKVAELNAIYKKDLSTNPHEKTYTGYEGKEGVEYKVRDGQWLKKEPGRKDFYVVTNKGSIEALNREFGENVGYSKGKDKYQRLVEDEAKLSEDKIEDNLSIINSKFLSDGIDPEDNVVVELKKRFPELNFSTEGWGTSNVMISDPVSGRSKPFAINNEDERDALVANEMKSFIRSLYSEQTQKRTELRQEESRIQDIENRLVGLGQKQDPREQMEGVMPVIPTDKGEVKKSETVLDIIEGKQKAAELRGEIAKEAREDASDAFLKYKNGEISATELGTFYANMESNTEVLKDYNNSLNDQKLITQEYKKEREAFEGYIADVEAKLQSGEMTEEEYIRDHRDNIAFRAEHLRLKGEELELSAYNSRTLSNLANKQAAANYLIQENKGSFLGAAGKKFTTGATQVVRGLAQMFTDERQAEEFQKFLIDEIAGYGTTEEYMGSEKRSDIEKASYSLFEMLGIMAGSGGTAALRNTGFFFQSYYEMNDELDGIEGITEGEKMLMSGLYGAASAFLEKLGLDAILGKSNVANNFKNKIMMKVFKDIPKDASKEYIEASIKQSTKKLLADYGIKAAGASLGEGVTESLQAGTQVLMKEVYDQIKSTDHFNNEGVGEIVGNIAYEGYLGMLGGGMMTSITSAPGVIAGSVNVSNNKEQLELISNLAQVEGIDEALLVNLKSKIMNGELTKEEAENIKDSFKTIRGKIESMPEDMTTPQKSQALDLMLEKDRIESKIKGKEDNLVVKEKARIEEINKSLQNIQGDAVQEQEAGEVDVDKQATTSEKVGEEVREPVEEQEDYATKEIDRVKELPEESEDGATMNLDGTKYEGGGLVVPLASKNMDSSELTREAIDEFIEEHSESIGQDNVKVGIYKFPNSSKVSIDLNIVADPSMREEALAIGRELGQESLFDLDTFENVKTGETGMETKQMTPSEFKAIQNRLTKTAKNQVTRENIVEAMPTASSKMRAATNSAISALSKAGVKVFVHKTTDEYNQAIADATGVTKEEIDAETGASRGEYITGKKEIHLNLEIADEKTVFHEAFHAVVENGQMPKSDIEEIADAIKKGTKDKKLIERADSLSQMYEEGEVNEEFLSEFVGILSSEEVMAKPKLMQKIIAIISKRLKMKNVYTKRQGHIDFINDLSTKLRRGEDVSDVTTTGISTTINKPKRKAQKVEHTGDYDLSHVKKEDIIDIDSLIDEIAESGQKVWFWVADQLGRGMYYDNVLNGEHYLDAGPSYALDPKNREENKIWATGIAKKSAERYVEENDYIFIVSGSPDKSKLFNKNVAGITRKRIENKVSFSTFKRNVIKLGTKNMKDVVSKYNSYEDLFDSVDRKKLLIEILDQSKKPNSKIHKLLKKYDAFVDPNELRDGFYRENNFEQGDIMLVLKPSAVGGKSDHSTYEHDIMGEVVGVPDKRVNSYDIMPQEVRDKYDSDINKSAQQQVVAPYGVGTKRTVERKKQLLPDEAHDRLTTDEDGNYILHNYGRTRRTKLTPKVTTGAGRQTSAQERAAINSVGGVVMFYTEDGQKELGVGNELHTVKIAQDKLYPFEQDPDNLIDEAERQFKEKMGDLAFNPNMQAAWVTKVAVDNGYDAVITKWNGGYRVQTTAELNVEKKNVPFKEPVQKEGVKKGDKVLIDGEPAIITKVEGDLATYKGYGDSMLVEGTIDKNDDQIEKDTPKRKKQLANDIIKRAEAIAKKNDYLNCEAFCNKMTTTKGFKTDFKKLDSPEFMIGELIETDAEIKSIRENLRAGDIVAFGDPRLPRHYAVYIEGDDMYEVEQWGAKPQIASFAENAYNYEAVAAVYREKITRKKQKQLNDKQKAISDAKAKYDLSKKRGNTEAQAKKSAMADLKKSNWYKDASDTDRESAVRNLRKKLGLKEKTAPSKEKITGKPKDKKITISEKAALKDQLKLEAKAARDAAKSEKDVRKAIAKAVIEKLASIQGLVSRRQLSAIANRALSMNLSNPKMEKRFLEYVDKVVNDDATKQKLNQAFDLKKKLKRIPKDAQATYKNIAKRFKAINPAMVQDLDEYIKMAEKVVENVSKSKVSRVKDEENIELDLLLVDRNNIEPINEYIQKEKEAQDEIKRQYILDKYADTLVANGIINDVMTLEEMYEAIRQSRTNTEIDQVQIDAIAEEVEQEFEELKQDLEEILETGVDPLTGEQLSDQEIKLIKDMLGVDLGKITDLKQALDIRDMIMSFNINGVVDSVAAKLSVIKGVNEAKKFSEKAKEKTIKGKVRERVAEGSRTWVSLFGTMDTLLKRLFLSRSLRDLFKRTSGFDAMIFGINKSKTILEKEMKQYAKTHVKKKANGLPFNDTKNAYQRGIYAFLIRNSAGTDLSIEKDFKRRMKLVVQTYQKLEQQKDKDIKVAQEFEVLNEVFDMMGMPKTVEGIDGYSVFDLESRVDKVNKDAVHDMISIWSKYYDELSFISRAVLNRELDDDVNYTSDRYVKIDGLGMDEDILIGKNPQDFAKNFADIISGSLTEVRKPNGIGDRIVSFDFENNQFKALEGALLDIHTAEAVKQLEGFMNSEYSKKPLRKEEHKLLSDKISRIVLMSRGKVWEGGSMPKTGRKILNAISQYVTSQVLGGFSQLIKQGIPTMMVTMQYAPVHAFKAMRMYMTNYKALNKWFEDNGVGVSVRGVKSTADVFQDNESFKKSTYGIRKILGLPGKGFSKVMNAWLYPLVTMDKGVAKVSFLAHYLKEQGKQGKSTKLDFTQPMDEVSMGKAEASVNELQNTSNEMLMGDFFTSKKVITSIVRKTMMPYSTFIMNQKTRVWTDASTVGSKASDLKEKGKAVKSIMASMVELMAYHSSRIAIGMAIEQAVMSFMGWDDEDDDPAVQKELGTMIKEENKRRVANGQRKMTPKEEEEFREANKNKIANDKFMDRSIKSTLSSAVADFFSPIPVTDYYVKQTVNKQILDPFQGWMYDEDLKDAIKIENANRKEPMNKYEEEKFRKNWLDKNNWNLYAFDNEANWGHLTIAYEKAEELARWAEAGNGVVYSEFMGTENKKYLTKEDADLAKNFYYLKLFTAAGLMDPGIGNNALYKAERMLKKSSLTAKQMTEYDLLSEYKKENNLGDVTKDEFRQIKKGTQFKNIK
jgi:hypothetical protein